jgi:hypothetical protein
MIEHLSIFTLTHTLSTPLLPPSLPLPPTISPLSLLHLSSLSHLYLSIPPLGIHIPPSHTIKQSISTPFSFYLFHLTLTLLLLVSPSLSPPQLSPPFSLFFYLTPLSSLSPLPLTLSPYPSLSHTLFVFHSLSLTLSLFPSLHTPSLHYKERNDLDLDLSIPRPRPRHSKT